ncbi:MAG: UDP-N-acetylmuramoyl-L-alanine--D-glutamate ligase [Bacteroidota bacterium]
MNVEGKKVTVVGAARSGLAVARLLAARGAEVFLTEQGRAAPGVADDLDAAGVAHEFGGHTVRALDADFLAVSPGVPTQASLVQNALGGSLAVYSEVEVASWFCDAPIIAVTGSNGKTTTTSLVAHIVRTADRPLVVAGNIGTAFADRVADCDAETLAVLEVSSFQLDHIDTFRPCVSVLLNITPDHLNRYDGDFGRYAAAKLRIFENQQPGDVLVYNHDDDLVRERAEQTAPDGVTRYPFSLDHELDRGAFVRDGSIVLRLTSPESSIAMEEVLMPASDLSLRGRHNLYNSLAAAVSARAMEISSDVVRESLASFEGVAHRLEFVRELGGVRYVNDSKATNVNAVWYALESFDEPVVLIAGGRDKGNDYASLVPLVKAGCRGVVGLGESGDKVVLELGDHAKAAARAQSMAEAIQFARLMAEEGDVILLSPACASFDMYTSYEQRGDEFKRLVNSL